MYSHFSSFFFDDAGTFTQIIPTHQTLFNEDDKRGRGWRGSALSVITVDQDTHRGGGGGGGGGQWGSVGGGMEDQCVPEHLPQQPTALCLPDRQLCKRGELKVALSPETPEIRADTASHGGGEVALSPAD